MSGVWRISEDGISTRLGSGDGVVAFLHGVVVGDGRHFEWQRFSFPIPKGLFEKDKPSSKQSSFKLDRSGRKIVIRVPHWFLVVMSSLVASIPWLAWRFSVRTLLIAITLVAVGLGAIAMILT
jgi:hypothetical protein